MAGLYPTLDAGLGNDLDLGLDNDTLNDLGRQNHRGHVVRR